MLYPEGSSLYLQGMFDWVDIMESKLDSMSPVGTDLETVKQQIEELKVSCFLQSYHDHDKEEPVQVTLSQMFLICKSSQL